MRTSKFPSGFKLPPGFPPLPEMHASTTTKSTTFLTIFTFILSIFGFIIISGVCLGLISTSLLAGLNFVRRRLSRPSINDSPPSELMKGSVVLFTFISGFGLMSCEIGTMAGGLGENMPWYIPMFAVLAAEAVCAASIVGVYAVVLILNRVGNKEGARGDYEAPQVWTGGTTDEEAATELLDRDTGAPKGSREEQQDEQIDPPPGYSTSA